VALLVIEEDPAELIQGLHPPGKDALQPGLLLGTVAQGLDPFGKAHQHQVGFHEGVFGLLGNRLSQVGGVDLGLRQVVTPGLLQLQEQQATQAKKYGSDERHGGLEQRQAFQVAARGVMRIVDGNRQRCRPDGKGLG